jgi:nicotinamidase-related amidase
MDQEILKEIRNPEKTALVIWDVQNALVDRIFNKMEFLSNVNELIAAARKRGIPIFFSKITPLPEQFESPPRRVLLKKRSFGTSPNALELTISPAENDIVIPKNTASIFIGTNFELMMRNAGVDTLIFAGISTEMGIESSGREALNRGFFAIIAKEAVSSPNKEAHERSLKNMEIVLIVLDNNEIMNLWNK